MKRVEFETDDGAMITFLKDSILYKTMSGRDFILTYEEFDQLIREKRNRTPHAHHQSSRP